MPELPEVEGYKQYIDSTCLHKKIISMECRDQKLLKMTLATFERHLLGTTFTETERIGKYLFLKTSGDRVLVIHFGMTGRPKYYKDKDDRPRFGHIVLAFDNGFRFAFENKRKFGWWDLSDDIKEYQKEKGLSDDARKLSLDQFAKSLENRKTDIKKILLDQSIAAGVGNWMADEILYQAAIHPEEQVSQMSQGMIALVYNAMQHVIEVAIKHDAHYADFPEDFLMHFRKEGGSCYHTGAAIQKIKVGGRSTYFSPERQKLQDHT